MRSYEILYEIPLQAVAASMDGSSNGSAGRGRITCAMLLPPLLCPQSRAQLRASSGARWPGHTVEPHPADPL